MSNPLTPQALRVLMEQLGSTTEAWFSAGETVLVNPDGPEAAAAISTLLARIEELEIGLAKIATGAPDIEMRLIAHSLLAGDGE